MCGIAGKLNFNGQPVKEEEINKMTSAIKHRGPDDSGVFCNGQVGLGHRRLSIIDLSARGHQPMWDSSKTVAIVYNGEIYNFKDLKKELINDGVSFYSETDTEVILYLYKKHGPECVKKLNGMFAFAIWDRNREHLFIARDRVGKKPFKYCLDNKTFVFSSELKAILTQPEIKKEIDWQAVDEYLSFKYVPCPRTGFKNIRKLPPAHYGIVKNKQLTITKYWQPDYRKKPDLSENEWIEKAENMIQKATAKRLISDVPLGAMLSGGIDSGLIVALMAQASNKQIKTFSIGFKEQKYNETEYARLVAQKYNTEHHEFILEPKGLNILPELASLYEEPYADASAIPSYYLSQMTRRHVAVALNGDGGDENFAGYDRYLALKYYRLLKYFPFKNLIGNFANSANRLSLVKRSKRDSDSNPDVKRLKNILPKISKQLLANYNSETEFYLSIINYFQPTEKQALLDRELNENLWKQNTLNLFEEYKNLNQLDKLLAVGLQTHLPDDLLIKVDIASMAHSLEARSPFLDHEVLELSAKLPVDLKIKGSSKKYLLKKIAERHIPRECIYRPKKGFTVPLGYWFKGELAGYINSELLADDFIQHGFNKNYISGMITDHRNGKYNYENQLYTLLMLRLWMKEYFGS